MHSTFTYCHDYALLCREPIAQGIGYVLISLPEGQLDVGNVSLANDASLGSLEVKNALLLANLASFQVFV